MNVLKFYHCIFIIAHCYTVVIIMYNRVRKVALGTWSCNWVWIFWFESSISKRGLVNEHVATCAYQGIRNVRFPENLACFVFLETLVLRFNPFASLPTRFIFTFFWFWLVEKRFSISEFSQTFTWEILTCLETRWKINLGLWGQHSCLT